MGKVTAIAPVKSETLRWCARVFVLAVVCLAGPVADAQDKPAADTEPEAAVRARVERLAAELETTKATAPPDAAALQERISVMEATLETAQRHLQIYEMQRGLVERRARAETASKEWRGTDKPPPYSILEADRYRASLLASEDALKVAVNFREMLGQTTQGVQERLVQGEAAVRRAREAMDKAAGDDAKMAARQALELEEAKLRLAAEEREALAMQLVSVDLAIEMERMKIELARRQRSSLGNELVFTQAELDKILAESVTRKAGYLEERKKAMRSSRAGINLKVAATGASARADVLNWLIAVEDVREALWRARFAMVNAPDTEARVREKSKLEELFSRPPMWKLLFESRIRNVKAALFELSAKADGAQDGGTDAELAAELAASEKLMQSGLERSVELQGLSTLWEVTGIGEGGRRSFGEWLVITKTWTKDTVLAIWNFELYMVDEVVEIDGRSVAGQRAITVGKVLLLVIILAAGYLTLRWLAGRITRRFQERFHMENATAHQVRKWLMGVGMAGLGLYALHYVRIPLTAFAFLGGALAIGVGFGTQNIIKNFISGIIIHFEKPFKVGDVVEAGAINGTVVDIGMRSSVVRHWDGIETLIPNSALLEDNVTNWTYSDRHLRHSLRVGVEYGSPLKQVVQLLQEAAAQHGLVLKNPAPFVLFDDFGESSLVFSLYFWIDVRLAGRAQVASDLRFIIEKNFGESGISMAFPQRDMRLSTVTPLDVRVLRDG